MSMSQIDLAKARRIAWDRGLKPVRIRGTNVVEFANRANTRFEVIDWTDFEANLKEKGLGVYEWRGWMKIMRSKTQSTVTMSITAPAPTAAPESAPTAAHEVSVEVSLPPQAPEAPRPPEPDSRPAVDVPSIPDIAPPTAPFEDPPTPPTPSPFVEPPTPMPADTADLLSSLDHPADVHPKRGLLHALGRLFGFGKKK